MPHVRISVGDEKRDRLVLEAKDAPLPQVLEEMARATGIRIHHRAPPEARVTATCADPAIKRVMECLLGPGANLMFRESDRASKSRWPAEIWVLGTGDGEGRSSVASEGASPRADGRQGEDAALKTAPTGDEAPADIPKLLDQARSEDPEQRAEALSRLIADGGADAATFRNLLGQALSDADAEVRAQAVYGLARPGGEGTAEMLRAALRDGDSSVRLMAVDSIGNGLESLDLLRSALTDGDETVRTLAAMKLEPLANSGSVE